jgi:integrase
MAVIERRSGFDGRASYRVKIRLKGHPPQSATFERVTDAKRWAQGTESAIREGRYFRAAESRRKTVADLVTRYVEEILPRKPKSKKQQARQLRWWGNELGYLFLADLSPAVIGKARDKLASTRSCRGRPRSSSTVVRYLAVLSHCLSVAVKEWCWIDANPMTRVSKPKEGRGRTRYLLDEERGRLLGECTRASNSAVYPIVVLAISTGMRKGEILNLRWEDVDLAKGRAILWETKNGEKRVVPLTGHALDVLKEWSKVKRIDTSLIFPGTQHGTDAKPLEFRKHWLAALDRAEVRDFRFHDLRHSTASYLAMSGATLSEIAEVLGHKTLQMVKRYSHLSEAHTTRVVKALNDRMFGAEHARLEDGL